MADLSYLKSFESFENGNKETVDQWNRNDHKKADTINSNFEHKNIENDDFSDYTALKYQKENEINSHNVDKSSTKGFQKPSKNRLSEKNINNWKNFNNICNTSYNKNNNNNALNNNENDDDKEIDSANLYISDSEVLKDIYAKPKLNLSQLDPKQTNTEMQLNDVYSTEESVNTISKSAQGHEKGVDDMKKCEKKSSKKAQRPVKLGEFDVNNIETSMPKFDLEAIESHLKAAKEEEKRRRNEREEIRRRLASGDSEEIHPSKLLKKPSLQTRLQNGMNLQICFMNEASSDTESPSSESTPSGQPNTKKEINPESPKASNITNKNVSKEIKTETVIDENADFFTKQSQLQAEARLALSQAKDRARRQMEADRTSGKDSPITEMLRVSLKKVGVPFSEERKRVSRQVLTEMNVAQLQVIVNDLHSQIEYLNESLVTFLMERDELHMSQDSMLVDIEDVTRYLGAKEDCLSDKVVQNNNVNPLSKTKSRTFTIGKN